MASGFPFEHVAPVLRDGHIIFGNLACVLSNNNFVKGRLSSLQLRGSPDSANGLKQAGFNVVSVTNNHSMDHGIEAFEETIETLRVRNIMPVGLIDSSGNCIPHVVQRAGVFLHWGNEYIQRPSPEQVRLAHTLIDNGADIISGHHPHCLQGIENYKSRLIVYSLGNFVFDY